MKAVRETYLDVAKFVAMLAIVFIHVRTNAPCREYGLVVGLDNFLTTFVLSLFVTVSGYLSRGLIFAGDWRKLANRVVGCLWPVFTMIVVLGELVLIGVHGKFVAPPMGWARYVLTAGWFFFCLAICTVLTFVAQKVSRGRKSWLALILSAVFVGLWAAPVGVCHAKDWIVYFWFGVYAYPVYAQLRHRRLIGCLALVFSVAVCFGLPDFREVGLFVHDAVMPQGSFTWSGCAYALAKYALGLSATLGVLELVRTLTDLAKDAPGLTRLGTQTMGVFFIHIQLIGVYFAVVGWAGWGVAGRVVIACAAFAVSHGLSVLTRKNRIVSAILWNPMSLCGRKS